MVEVVASAIDATDNAGEGATAKTATIAETTTTRRRGGRRRGEEGGGGGRIALFSWEAGSATTHFLINSTHTVLPVFPHCAVEAQRMRSGCGG